MNSRERVLAAFNRSVPDRVPQWAPGLVPAQLEVFKAKTGCASPEEYFKSDVRTVRFQPAGELPDFSRYYRDVTEPYEICYWGAYSGEWGVAQVKSDFYHLARPLFPMRNFTSVSELEEYPFPNYARDWKHDHLEAEVARYHEAGFFVVGWVGHLFQTTWLMRSREKLFLDFVENQEFAHRLLDRVAEIRTAVAVRQAEAGVDGLALADDIAMQDRMMMSPAMWRHWIKPRLAGLIAAARKVKPDLHVLYHSDGNTEPVIPELAEVGVTVLNTVQPECMDPAEIKRKYGDRLAFAGTIGAQSVLPFGTPDDVRRQVKEHLKTVGKGGGLMISPANSVEPDVPWENIVAMYDAAEEFGVYRQG